MINQNIFHYLKWGSTDETKSEAIESEYILKEKCYKFMCKVIKQFTKDENLRKGE